MVWLGGSHTEIKGEGLNIVAILITTIFIEGD
jgi:hypothetical protein